MTEQFSFPLLPQRPRIAHHSVHLGNTTTARGTITSVLYGLVFCAYVFFFGLCGASLQHLSTRQKPETTDRLLLPPPPSPRSSTPPSSPFPTPLFTGAATRPVSRLSVAETGPDYKLHTAGLCELFSDQFASLEGKFHFISLLLDFLAFYDQSETVMITSPPPPPPHPPITPTPAPHTCVYMHAKRDHSTYESVYVKDPVVHVRVRWTYAKHPVVCVRVRWTYVKLKDPLVYVRVRWISYGNGELTQPALKVSEFS